MADKLRPDELAAFKAAFDMFDKNQDGTISTKVSTKINNQNLWNFICSKKANFTLLQHFFRSWILLMSDSITYPAVKYREQWCCDKKRNVKRKQWVESIYTENVSQGNTSLLHKQDEMFVSMLKARTFWFYLLKLYIWKISGCCLNGL